MFLLGKESYFTKKKLLFFCNSKETIMFDASKCKDYNKIMKEIIKRVLPKQIDGDIYLDIENHEYSFYIKDPQLEWDLFLGRILSRVRRQKKI